MSTRPPDWQLPASVTPGLWDYLHDDTLAQQYLSKVSDSPFARADQRFVDELLPAPCTVIDLGCGPGRSLLPLAQRGFTCTGLDLSPPMLEQARALFEQHLQQATWITANLGEPLPIENNSFDAALCLFGTLGMLQPVSSRAQVLREAYRIIKPGGSFLLHVHNRWAIQGWRALFTSDVITMPVHQGIARLQMKLYTHSEITRDLTQAGWRIKQMEPVAAETADGQYHGSRWVAPYRAAGFLLAAVKPNP
jgi:ubiquinone/menaquinone biosynthesis C-methylase UbiE